jgi:hypothetical protein
MESDFSRLYAQLDLRPDCTLEDFKHAYRKRVAELHPDRQGNGMPHESGTLSLSELTTLYATATRFHRLHGRLPGARSRTRTAPTGAGEPASHSSGTQLLAVPPDDDRNRENYAGKQRSLFAVLVVLLVVILMLVLDSSPPQAPRTPPRGTTPSGSLTDDAHRSPSEPRSARDASSPVTDEPAYGH